jgi:hypothetical protein
MRHMDWRECFLLAGATTLWFAGCKQKELEPTPPEPSRLVSEARPTPEFKPIAAAPQDAQESTLIAQALPQLHSRIEVRTIIIQAGKPVTLPMQYEGILELRAGSLASTADNTRLERRRGEMWQVTKGDRVTFEATGELAVVRAIYLIPDEK